MDDKAYDNFMETSLTVLKNTLAELRVFGEQKGLCPAAVICTEFTILSGALIAICPKETFESLYEIIIKSIEAFKVEDYQ